MRTLPLLIAALSLSSAALCSAAEKRVSVVPSASFVNPGDTLAALSDDKEPKHSHDTTIPRFTFWDHRGGTEWVQYSFDRSLKVSSVEVYWYDDRPGGACRVPKAWRLLHQVGYEWLPVAGASGYGITRDQYNRVAFPPVTVTALRIEVQQQPNASSGILQWKINGRTQKLGPLGGVGPDLASPGAFDYPAMRLALATLVESVGPQEPEAEQSLARLDSLTETYLAARAQAGFGDTAAVVRMSAAAEQLEEIGRRYGPAAVVTRLDAGAPDRCLKLMIRLDWLEQDAAKASVHGFLPLASAVIDELGPAGAKLAARREKMLESTVAPSDPRWMQLYLDACDRRRAARLGPHLETLRRVVFTKHHDIGGQHYAYTEDVSDSPYNDNNPFPHSGKLCLLEMDGLYGTVRTLLDEPNGLIRDPEVSYDGRRILFARRTSMTEDDYHLYEMTVADGRIRQLTFGRGVADYEPAYLPGGDIIFNSSRCQQIVDCWWADVSNLFTCDADGRFLRRISFDQVHTNYPKVLDDGRVTYTRWDYNDRGQLFPQPLFVMNADGTGQTEFYGNNSWFPTTILHARGIPGTQKLVCVLSGHHTYQKGKLAIIDPNRGRQENSGVQLIAPVRETEAVRIDKYGYQGEQFQYPYALSQTDFLVTYTTTGSKKGRDRAEKPFGIYVMTIDGRRELLAADPKISCNQAIPLAPRSEPRVRPSRVDYRKDAGTYFLQDIYVGPGLQGVARGTIKRLRVVALEFRAAGVGSNNNRGPAGGALVSTPISINGAWDVKRVLGSAEVYDDGSAAFTVPARTPVYFQALDENNHVVQTMRSWSTLQPGETFSCVGCHEDKNSTPPAAPVLTRAMQAGPQPLEPFYGDTRGFSFPRLIQPILDKHCVSCHRRDVLAEKQSKISLTGSGAFDDRARKTWSDAYKALADPAICSWVSPQSGPPMLPPYHTGAAKSRLIEMLAAGHEDVELSREEMDKLACWIDLAVPFSGDYTEGMDEKSIAQYEPYLQKRRRWEAEEAENIRALVESREKH